MHLRFTARYGPASHVPSSCIPPGKSWPMVWFWFLGGAPFGQKGAIYIFLRLLHHFFLTRWHPWMEVIYALPLVTAFLATWALMAGLVEKSLLCTTERRIGSQFSHMWVGPRIGNTPQWLCSGKDGDQGRVFGVPHLQTNPCWLVWSHCECSFRVG